MNHINKMPLAVCLKWDVLNEPIIFCAPHHRGSQLPQMSWVGPSAQSAETEHYPVSPAKCETDGPTVPAGWLWGAALGWERSRYQDELNEDTRSSGLCGAPEIPGIVSISSHSHVFRIQKGKVQETGFGEKDWKYIFPGVCMPVTRHMKHTYIAYIRHMYIVTCSLRVGILPEKGVIAQTSQSARTHTSMAQPTAHPSCGGQPMAPRPQACEAWDCTEQHEMKSSTRQSDAMRRCRRHLKVSEAAASITQHSRLYRTFLKSWGGAKVGPQLQVRTRVYSFIMIC